MKAKHYLAIASVFIAISIALQAGASHALKPLLSEREFNILIIASRYLFVGAISLFLSEIAQQLKWISSKIISPLFLLATLVFSGTLLLFLIIKAPILTKFTPLGGSGLIVTWLYFGLCLVKSRTFN